MATRRLMPQPLAALALLLVGLPAPVSADTSHDNSEQVLEWNEFAPLPDPQGFAGAIVGIADGALIVAGGTNFPDGRPWDGASKVWSDRIFVLSAPDESWQELEERLPRPLAHAVSLTIREGIVVIGGGDAERHYREVFLLRLENGRVEFDPWPPLPEPLALAAGAIAGETIFFAGGVSSPDAVETEKIFLALDMSAPADVRQWRELPSWPGPGRMLASAAGQNDSFFLFSGVDLRPGPEGAAQRLYHADAYRYEPHRGWRRIADLPRPAAAAATPAPALGPDNLLILGGDTGEHVTRIAELKDDHPGFSRGVLAYHTITDTWTAIGEVPPQPPAVTGAAWWQDRLVLPTGEVRPGVRTNRVLGAAPSRSSAAFYTLDYVVLVAYLASLVAMGVYFSHRTETTENYFLGGRRIPWWAVGLSIFGTQLSAITFMAVPALVFRTDWVYLLGNLMILAIAPLVIHLFLPFYRRLGVTTIYEYLELRFSLAVRLVGSLAYILFQLGRMGVILYLPALALATVTDIDVLMCIAVMGVLATLYTFLGGIEAVVWTDVVQVLVLLCGAVASLIVATLAIDGGLGTVIRDGLAYDKFRVANLTWNVTTTALWLVVVGKFFEQLVSYTSDQTVAQRYLTTRSERQAARSIWTNGLLTVPASLLFFMLGTTLWAFYRHHPQRLNPLGQGDDILPWFVARELPVGISGLVIAGLFAASMSSLDSAMNSVSTSITTDFYRRFRPSATDRQALRLAKWLTLLIGALGTGTALYLAMGDDRSMWDAYLRLVGLFGGGLTGLFVAGIFTRRTTAAGALVGFAASGVLLYWLANYTAIHFFLFAGAGVVSCVLVAWMGSWLLGTNQKPTDGLTIYSMPGRGHTAGALPPGAPS